MVEYGTGPVGHPCHRFGAGSERLVIVPGVMDPLGWNTPSRLTAELLARHYFRAFREYDVWVVSRPPGLSPGTTARDLGDRYARVLDAIGSAHVLGLSLGGMIATHLAARHPEQVNRLVLVACGTHLGENGRHRVRRWRRLADGDRWTALHVDYARTVYSGTRAQTVLWLYRLASPWLPRPLVPADVSLSCDAMLAYDGTDVLDDIEAPALVVADSDGTLVPERLQRDGARRLPDGYVVAFEGGHAVYEERRREFGRTVLRFLDGEF